jgi:hypothetical protein
MISVVSAVALLVYLGRALAWAWGTKPLEAGDVVLLLPIVVVAVLIRKRAVRLRLLQNYERPAPPNETIVDSPAPSARSLGATAVGTRPERARSRTCAQVTQSS